MTHTHTKINTDNMALLHTAEIDIHLYIMD